MVGYPFGLDYGWLGCDADGHVAVFTSAGEGLIPLSIIAARPTADKAEELVEQLPVRGEFQPPPDRQLQSFAEFASRGFYSYDWPDIFRSTLVRSSRYELMVRPALPALLSELPSEIASLALLARFGSLRFAKAVEIAIQDHLECWPAS